MGLYKPLLYWVETNTPSFRPPQQNSFFFPSGRSMTRRYNGISKLWCSMDQFLGKQVPWNLGAVAGFGLEILMEKKWTWLCGVPNQWLQGRMYILIYSFLCAYQCQKKGVELMKIHHGCHPQKMNIEHHVSGILALGYPQSQKRYCCYSLWTKSSQLGFKHPNFSELCAGNIYRQ